MEVEINLTNEEFMEMLDDTEGLANFQIEVVQATRKIAENKKPLDIDGMIKLTGSEESIIQGALELMKMYGRLKSTEKPAPIFQIH